MVEGHKEDSGPKELKMLSTQQYRGKLGIYPSIYLSSMVGWHHQFNGHELGQIPGDGEGQGGLACCSPWGHKSQT